ncbi:hypothetical protein C7B70_24510 [Chlorogloea sp. CCALA 695]|nr:hypothetical protein C7B70_24510 [Chlorogloea sp. CCALA 695]
MIDLSEYSKFSPECALASRKTLKAFPTPPRVITVDKNPAALKAIKELNSAKKLPEIGKLM